MNFKLFLNQFPHFAALPQSLHTMLENRLQFRELQRGQHLLMPDEVCKHVYLILSGFFRSYLLSNGLEQTVGFAGKGQLFTIMKSFFKQQKTQEGIICENTAQVFSLSYHDWRALEDLSVDFLQLGKAIMEDQLLIFQSHLAIYRLGNATAKYLHLCQEYPHISSMVSQKHIASYIGITEQSMSIIRKNLLRNT